MQCFKIPLITHSLKLDLSTIRVVVHFTDQYNEGHDIAACFPISTIYELSLPKSYACCQQLDLLKIRLLLSSF